MPDSPYTHLPPVPAALERHPEAVDWQDVSDEKQQLLARVEAHTLDHFHELLEANAPAPPPARAKPARRWVMPILVPSLGTALGVLLFMQTSTPRPVRPAWSMLQATGQASMTWTRDKKGRQTALKASVPSAKSLRVADKGKWSIAVAGGSALSLKRQTQHDIAIDMPKGSLVAHITPNTMKQFNVHCQHGYGVHVKGTVFAVRQGPKWLRVEVMRGKVALTHRAKPLAVLTKGQGIRLSDKGISSRYAVLTRTKSTWKDRMAHMQQHNPKQVSAYIDDLLAQPGWDQTKKRGVLKDIASMLTQAGQASGASSLWMRLYKQQPTGLDGQTALYNAAQACRRATPSAPRCTALYKQWLTTFPNGDKSMHQASLNWLLMGMRLQGVPFSQQLRWIKLNQTRYPHGTYHPYLPRRR